MFGITDFSELMPDAFVCILRPGLVYSHFTTVRAKLHPLHAWRICLDLKSDCYFPAQQGTSICQLKLLKLICLESEEIILVHLRNIFFFLNEYLSPSLCFKFNPVDLHFLHFCTLAIPYDSLVPIKA